MNGLQQKEPDLLSRNNGLEDIPTRWRKTAKDDKKASSTRPRGSSSY
jgi:hypothetical protein